MFLGIEIGGTKLQLGVGDGRRAEFADFKRADIDPQRGARGILDQIRQLGLPLVRTHAVTRVGFGFGGPVDSARGHVIKSHQVSGWEDFALGPWCREQLGVPAVLGNDCDVATLAEAHFGAGQGKRSVFFITVGTGVGGGFVCNGQLLGAGRPAASEIGHLRPGPDASDPSQTVESLASGWGIAAAARRRLTAPNSPAEASRELLARCDEHLEQLTARTVADAAQAGNILARQVLEEACRVLGWAIAQAITLLAPEVVVVGGGVSLVGDEFFFTPLRREVARFVFPPLSDSYAIEPAALGESVVVHGAVWLAAASR